MTYDIFHGLGVEIELAADEDFLKVKETLTRIGVASKKSNVLYQSCHILHKQGRYSILHFKELFILDRKPTEFSQDDLGRRNTIAKLLDEWGLARIIDPSRVAEPLADMRNIKVISFKQKDEWTLVPKYQIGIKKV